MNWLAVIKAGRELRDDPTEKPPDEAALKVDVFENDVGKEENVDPLEAASLAAVLTTTCAQIHILAMGSSCSVLSANSSVREKLIKVLEETEVCLRARGSFSALFSSARHESSRMQEAQWLEALAVRNKETIAALRSKLLNNQKIKQKELHKKQQAIASLKDQIEELASKRDVALFYVDKSLASQREQSMLRSDNSEQMLRSDLDLLKDKIGSELTVHDSLHMFLNHSITELEEQITKWITFYDSELIRRNEKLEGMRLKISEEKAKVTELAELYEEHQREINEYLEYKEQKRLEAEHDQFLYDSATKIQAWWRGTMVRRGLGPYKKRKKAAAKDKKKKK